MLDRAQPYLSKCLNKVSVGDITFMGQFLEKRYSRDRLSFDEVLEEQIGNGAFLNVLRILAFQRFTDPGNWDAIEGSEALARAYEQSRINTGIRLADADATEPEGIAQLKRNLKIETTIANRLRRQAGLPSRE